MNPVLTKTERISSIIIGTAASTICRRSSDGLGILFSYLNTIYLKYLVVYQKINLL